MDFDMAIGVLSMWGAGVILYMSLEGLIKYNRSRVILCASTTLLLVILYLIYKTTPADGYTENYKNIYIYQLGVYYPTHIYRGEWDITLSSDTYFEIRERRTNKTVLVKNGVIVVEYFKEGERK